MTSIYIHIITTFIFVSTILNSPATTTSQECPYPCYPTPPAGAGNSQPVTPTPPAGSNYPPPAPYGKPPPTGYLPNSPPPPYYLNAAPPPPDHMVPWFPYYYRKPPHESDQSSSPSLHLSGWTAVIMYNTAPLLVFSYVLLYK